MNPSALALFSILVGIIAANFFAYFKPKYSFDYVGNSIAGVFGSVLFIKSFGRLGFGPLDIVNSGNFNIILFLINIIVASIGGVVFLIFIKKMKIFIQNKTK